MKIFSLPFPLLMTGSLVLAFALSAPALSAPTRTNGAERWQAWQNTLELQQSSPLRSLPWRAIGPAVQGGRVVDIELDPVDENTYYVAYASGGLWKTTNNGQHFESLSDRLPTMISGDLAIDPNNPQVIWLGTGEPNASRSSYSGLGIFKSEDGGTSFVSKGLLDADRISKVLIDPSDSQRILVAVQGPLYSASSARGIYLTEDGGGAWTQVLAGSNAWTGASEVLHHPSDSSIVYAALWDTERKAHDYREAGIGSGIFRSTDSGRTWKRLPGFDGAHIGRIGLAVSSAKPDWIYASVDNHQKLPTAQVELGDDPLSSGRLKTMSKQEFLAVDSETIELFLRGLDFPVTLDAAELRGKVERDELSMDALRQKLLDGNSSLFNTEIRGLQLYRSESRGDDFTLTHNEPIRNVTYNYGYYFGKVSVAPDNANEVTLLGVPVVQSLDGGKTFSGAVNAKSVHVDHHVWKIDPRNPNRIFNGNDGGIDVSYDRGKHFARADQAAHGQSYTLNFDMATPYNVYTGMQDNGTYKGSSKSEPDDLEAWTFVSGGDGMQIQVDPRDGSLYTGYQFGNYQYSGAGGHSVRPKAPLNEPLYRFNWQTPILLSSHNSDVLYMGGNKFFRSLDKGKTFEPISGDLTRSRARGDVPFATLTSIAESKLQFGLLWAGSDDGQVWVSDDGGAQWRDVAKNLPDYWISAVEPSQSARFRAYVALNGYRQDNQRPMLYITDNLGRSFRSISKGLPNSPINVIREDPLNPDVLYVGTDRGAYASVDRGNTWMSIGSNLPNVAVHDLRVHPRERELIAGTHGRSVWIIDALPIQELAAAQKAKTLKALHVDPFAFERSLRGRSDGWFEHLSPATEIKLQFYAVRAGEVKIEIKDQHQALLQTLSVKAIAGMNHHIWNALVDPTLALEAEQQQTTKLAVKPAEPKTAASTAPEIQALGPYQQAQRYGWPFYLQPGEYSLHFSQGAEQSEVSLKVNAPRAIPSRKPEALKIRGK